MSLDVFGWDGGWVVQNLTNPTFFEEASSFLSGLSVRVGQTPVPCPIDQKLKQPCTATQSGLRGV